MIEQGRREEGGEEEGTIPNDNMMNETRTSMHDLCLKALLCGKREVLVIAAAKWCWSASSYYSLIESIQLNFGQFHGTDIVIHMCMIPGSI